MNRLDIIILCLAVFGFARGLFHGIIRQIASLAALIIAIILCGTVAGWVQNFLLSMQWFPEIGIKVISHVVAFALIIVLVVLAGKLVNKLISVTPLNLVNHIIGGVVGAALMLVFLSLLFNVMEVVDRGSVLCGRERKVESVFYYKVQEIVPTIYPFGLFAEKDSDVI